MKFYCIEKERVLTEQEQTAEYEKMIREGYIDPMSREEWLDIVLNDEIGCITEEIDIEEIAKSAIDLYHAIAKGGFGFDNVRKNVKPSAEDFAKIRALGDVLKKASAEAKDIYYRYLYR